MSAHYDDKLEVLRKAIKVAAGNPFSIEQELEDLLMEDGADVTADLLLSLSDDAHSGAMYALVHAAEASDEAPYRTYISTVLSAFPQLSKTAPNWALMVLRRIMNADDSFCELLIQLRDAPASVKASVRKISDENNVISPDYMPDSLKGQVAEAAS